VRDSANAGPTMLLSATKVVRHDQTPTPLAVVQTILCLDHIPYQLFLGSPLLLQVAFKPIGLRNRLGFHFGTAYFFCLFYFSFYFIFLFFPYFFEG